MIEFISLICGDDIGVIWDVKAASGYNFHAKHSSRRVGPIGEEEEYLSLCINSPNPIGILGEGAIMPWPKGKPHPFRGKTYEEIYGEERANEIKEKLSKALMGNQRCKGRVLSEKTKRKISLAATGRTHSEETKQKMSLTRRGKKLSLKTRRKLSKIRREHPILTMKGKHLSDFITEETRIRRIEKLKAARLKQVFPMEDTKIERLIQKELTRRGLIFETHVSILGKYQVDILIGNLVIECDGNYWHNFPDGLEKDRIRDRELIEAGYQVLHFWGHEIKSDVKGCVDEILEVVEGSQVVGERVVAI